MKFFGEFGDPFMSPAPPPPPPASKPSGGITVAVSAGDLISITVALIVGAGSPLCIASLELF